MNILIAQKVGGGGTNTLTAGFKACIINIVRDSID